MNTPTLIRQAAAFVLAARLVAAQEHSVCPPGQRVLADYGYAAIECVNCEINSRAAVWMIFHAPARLRDIRADGPAFGKLAEGDTLVAIDGLDVTVRAGSERYSTALPGDQVQFTVRRNGSPVTVPIVAGFKCMPGTLSSSYRGIRGSVVYRALGRSTRAADSATSQSRGWVGVGITTTVPPDSIALPSMRSRPFSEPPRVAAVAPGSPAAIAGIQAGDRLLAIDGASLLSFAGADRFRNPVVGVPMKVLLIRDGEEHTVTVVPAKAPAEPPSVIRQP
jgi:S1-C subfamily serine protease